MRLIWPGMLFATAIAVTCCGGRSQDRSARGDEVPYHIDAALPTDEDRAGILVGVLERLYYETGQLERWPSERALKRHNALLRARCGLTEPLEWRWEYTEPSRWGVRGKHLGVRLYVRASGSESWREFGVEDLLLNSDGLYWKVYTKGDERSGREVFYSDTLNMSHAIAFFVMHYRRERQEWPDSVSDISNLRTLESMGEPFSSANIKAYADQVEIHPMTDEAGREVFILHWIRSGLKIEYPVERAPDDTLATPQRVRVLAGG